MPKVNQTIDRERLESLYSALHLSATGNKEFQGYLTGAIKVMFPTFDPLKPENESLVAEIEMAFIKAMFREDKEVLDRMEQIPGKFERRK